MNKVLGSKDFEIVLPQDVIAQFPSEKRDDCKLFIYNRATQSVEHLKFMEITRFMQPGDCLVINETRVLPARFFGKKETGGRVEVLFLEAINNESSKVLLRPGLDKDSVINLKDGSILTVGEYNSEGSYTVNYAHGFDIYKYMEQNGVMPLPPYIKRVSEKVDADVYQTVFAKQNGSVAAPTAGLHFTDELLKKISDSGVNVVKLILHIGLATFKKIKTDDFNSFKMLGERYQVSDSAARTLNNAMQDGKKIFAVGTSCVRTLESSIKNGSIVAGSGVTGIFIHPGYEFKAVDAMITNFHLSDSGPLFLAAAFLHNRQDNIDDSPKLIKKLYGIAMENSYKFYSYGDAMLIL